MAEPAGPPLKRLNALTAPYQVRLAIREWGDLDRVVGEAPEWCTAQGWSKEQWAVVYIDNGQFGVFGFVDANHAIEFKIRWS